jgi:hypothetical protein
MLLHKGKFITKENFDSLSYLGLTKQVKVGDFFTLVSMKLPYSCHMAKI